jgi:hypothetical protein
MGNVLATGQPTLSLTDKVQEMQEQLNKLLLKEREETSLDVRSCDNHVCSSKRC